MKMGTSALEIWIPENLAIYTWYKLKTLALFQVLSEFHLPEHYNIALLLPKLSCPETLMLEVSIV